jgi:pyruvate/2-oxoglutarate dehydrogenase complex dihydrolipoamide dehydrogenase (E3) component
MAAAEQFDAIVIGTGQGGKPLAGAFARAGWETAILERADLVGGTCVTVGCTPTKTMVASARVAHLVRRAAEYGVNVGTITVDQTVVRQRKRAIVDMFSEGSRRGMERLEHNNLIMGEGRFTGPHDLEVTLNDGSGTRAIRSEKIFLNVGARPFAPPVPGLADVDYLDSSSILELGEVPPHLVILGGGFVGVEFAQMFRRFGSEVTILEMGDRCIPHEDRDVADAIQQILTEDGIDVRCGNKAKQVDRADSGGIAVTVETAKGEAVVSGSHLLVAAGRRPNSDSLNLEAAGVEVNERGFIQVNERLETNVPGIWALGDVTGGPAFTHIAYDDYRILKRNVLEGGDASTAGRLVPYTVFIDPELGRVGLSEEDAKKQGLDYDVVTMPMSHVARALESDETRGFMKAVVDSKTKQILGCAILGIAGGELMSMLEIAMMGKVSAHDLRDAVFSHPNLSEAFNNLFAKL